MLWHKGNCCVKCDYAMAPCAIMRWPSHKLTCEPHSTKYYTKHTITNTKFYYTPNAQTTQSSITTNNNSPNMYNKKTMLKFSELTRNKNNNRYLSKNKIHKKIHNNLHTKTIINLSNKNLSTSTISTLAKGLHYIPSPKTTPYNQIYKSFLTYRKNMYNRYYFRHT